MGRRVDTLGDTLRRVARPWELAVFGGLPALFFALVIWVELSRAKSLVDFAVFRNAANAVLHGRSPYVSAEVHGVAGFVYPPVTGLAFAPFAILPNSVARALILVLGGIAVLVALRLLGVRDWRCYGLSLLMAPTVNSVTLGAITPFLLCGIAATWRYRDRANASGAICAGVAVAKVFLWPMAVWLAATRRIRAAVSCLVYGLVLVFAGWAVIGFADLTRYPHLLRELTKNEALRSYSLAALFGLSSGGALALAAVVALLVVAATVMAARGSDGDRRALTVAVVGALLATPVMWLHYLLLLLVPIALYRPRLSGLWFAPLLMWATPQTLADGSRWRVAIALLLAVGVLVRLLQSPAGRLPARRRAPGVRLLARSNGSS